MYNYRVCAHTFTSLPTCSYLHELMFRALNIVIVTPYTLHVYVCANAHADPKDGQYT